MFYTLLLAALVIYVNTGDMPLRPFLPGIVPLGVVTTAAVMAVSGTRPALNHSGVALVCAYGLAVAISVMASQTLDFFSYRKIALPLSALIVVAFRYRVTITGLLRFSTALFVVSILYVRVKDPTAGIVSDNLLSTDSYWESVYSIALGGIAVWFFSELRYLQFLVTFLGSIILYKRNAFIAAAFVSLLSLVLNQVRLSARQVLMTANGISALAIVTLTVVSFNLPTIFQFVVNEFAPAMTVDDLSSGRDRLYSYILVAIGNGGIVEQLFGHGPGAIERFIASYPDIARNVIAHNEYLSLYFDYGFVGFSLIVLAMWRVARYNVRSVAVFLYICCVFFIENLLFISFVFMVILFLLAAEPLSTRAKHSTHRARIVL